MDVPVLGCWWATATLVLGAILYLYFTRTHGYWRKRGVPYVKPLPLFGNLKDALLFRKNLGEIYRDLYWKLDGCRYGGVFKCGQPSLLVRDPELIKTILVKEFNSFHDNDIETDTDVDPMFGRNPFVLTGERWKTTRSQLTPAFTLGKIKPYFPLIAEVCTELKHCIEKSGVSGAEFEVKDLCARYTTDVVTTCAYGIRGNALQDPDCEFRQIGREILEPSFWQGIKLLIFMLFPCVAKILRIGLGTPKAHRFLQRVVNEVIEYREKNNVTRPDYLQHLITLKKKGETASDRGLDDSYEKKGLPPEQSRFTNEDIVAQAATFFADGYETSSAAMAFGLYCLALNPDVQTKVRDEVDAVLKKYGGELTFDGIQEMTYLDLALSESLRMYPPALVLVKVCTKPFELETPSGGTYKVQVGTPAAIPVYAIHHDPQHYPDPQRYDPERFNEEIKKTRHRYSYLPFGDGPRMCLGFRFALLQVKAGIATVISNFRIFTNKRTPIPVKPEPNSLILTAKGGLWLYLERRTDK